VRSKGERLRSKLREALGHNPHVKEVRGLGLICGVQLDVVRLEGPSRIRTGLVLCALLNACWSYQYDGKTDLFLKMVWC